MTKASDNQFPKITLAESAAPATPASGLGFIYEKTDNKLYFKNDAGTETELTAVIGSGTGFPGSPTTNQLFYRTDLAMLFYYNGTRWLSSTLFREPIGPGNASPVSAGALWVSDLWDTDYADLWLEKAYLRTYSSALSGSAYWTLKVKKVTAAEVVTELVSVTNQSGTNSQWENKTTAINALLGTSNVVIYWTLDKTGSPGPCYIAGGLTYRIVAT